METLLEHFDWVLFVITAIQHWLVGDKWKYSFLFGVCVNGMWAYYGYLIGQTGLIPLAIVLCIIHIRNHRKWNYVNHQFAKQ